MSDLPSPPPLTGIKVVELARVLAGPWAGQTLADLGAEVIKIESPSGDDTRQWGPPFIESFIADKGEKTTEKPTKIGTEKTTEKTAAYFHSCNRGKKSVVLDFKNPEDLATLKILIAECDVLIENFKVDGLKKYGLDYASQIKQNPRLIYCSITGFGQTGPYAHRAGYDFLMQGMSGLMSYTGSPSSEPQKVGVAITDIATGLYSVIAIQSALIARQNTGKGQHIDMSLLDVSVALSANQGMNYLATGHAPNRRGNDHPNIVPYRAFRLKDGWIILAVGNDGQFASLCQVLDCFELAKDPRFATNSARVENREALIPLLETRILPMTRADLLAACETAGVPAGPINDMADVFADSQVKHRGLQIDLDGVASIRNPIVFSSSELARMVASPALGADTVATKNKQNKG